MAKKKTKKTITSRKRKKKTSATPKSSAKKRTTKKKAAKKNAVRSSRATAKAKSTAPKSTVTQKTSGAQLPTILVSPDYSGAPSKLAKDTYPEDAAAKDFKCFGPPATHDGELDDVRICDLGCFAQDGRDSNKYYHGAVVQHRKSKNWYAYFEWGRTGGSTCSFQFVACQSEEDARAAFAKQLHAKNDKRGEWVTVANVRTLRAKKGKDCYLVRPMATRSTGLPDARNIKLGRATTESGTKPKSAPDMPCGDPKTTKLLRDLQLATIAYTRKSMADSSIPTQRAINEARQFLSEAQSQVASVGEEIEEQVNDKQLMRLTELMFSRIPRKKRVGAAPSTWMLTSENIQDWQDDLDAFESALRAVDMELNPKKNLLGDMNMDMCWIDPASDIGQFLYDWCPHSTVKQHKKINAMTILNAWKIEQRSHIDAVSKAQRQLLKSKVDTSIKPLHQPRKRIDVTSKDRSVFKKSNTAILFHGTRSVNVNAILRESLRMPLTLVAVPITGAKFGPGIYFSDDWKKAADYTNAKGSAEAGRKGAVRGRQAFMFVADVVLGTPHIAPHVKGYTKPPRGHHSVFGKAGVSGVEDNEFVVYKERRFELRYLIEFKTS